MIMRKETNLLKNESQMKGNMQNESHTCVVNNEVKNEALTRLRRRWRHDGREIWSKMKGETVCAWETRFIAETEFPDGSAPSWSSFTRRRTEESSPVLLKYPPPSLSRNKESCEQLISLATVKDWHEKLMKYPSSPDINLYLGFLQFNGP